MGRPRWHNTYRQREEGSLRPSVAFLPLGFIFLQLIGCTLIPGSSAAPKKDLVPTQMRQNAVVERKVKGQEQKDVRPQAEQSQMEKKFGIETDIQPSSQEQQSPSEDSLLPPLPAKPPPMGGSGG